MRCFCKYETGLSCTLFCKRKKACSIYGIVDGAEVLYCNESEQTLDGVYVDKSQTILLSTTSECSVQHIDRLQDVSADRHRPVQQQ